jgi:predicted HAD superfamily Cof-like phosphohydrolase
VYNDVKTFIEACDQEHTEKNAELYYNLVKRDEVERLDACMDMIWVILGFCIMKGYDVEGAWNEVARSNLAKINSETGKVIKREDGKVLKPEGWTPPSLEQFVK